MQTFLYPFSDPSSCFQSVLDGSNLKFSFYFTDTWSVPIICMAHSKSQHSLSRLSLYGKTNGVACLDSYSLSSLGNRYLISAHHRLMSTFLFKSEFLLSSFWRCVDAEQRGGFRGGRGRGFGARGNRSRGRIYWETEVYVLLSELHHIRISSSPKLDYLSPTYTFSFVLFSPLFFFFFLQFNFILFYCYFYSFGGS